MEKISITLIVVSIIMVMIIPPVVAQMTPFTTYQDQSCVTSEQGDICTVFEDMNENGVCDPEEVITMPKSVVESFDIPVCPTV